MQRQRGFRSESLVADQPRERARRRASAPGSRHDAFDPRRYLRRRQRGAEQDQLIAAQQLGVLALGGALVPTEHLQRSARELRSPASGSLPGDRSQLMRRSHRAQERRRGHHALCEVERRRRQPIAYLARGTL
ncbi:hypothetical protein BE18_05620 [Sorangium cellulosum]|uniref:Uncharacterized protein n=1 Tax=Sorangium cellulosum TaxID=56 RepID=A0A150SYL0_SORCE|nr:hypothetical protein BE18_05620 [Sorangium cellulosum]